MAQLVIEPIVKTNAVAADILMDVSSFLETPIKGQRLRILLSTILLTRTVLIFIKK